MWAVIFFWLHAKSEYLRTISEVINFISSDVDITDDVIRYEIGSAIHYLHNTSRHIGDFHDELCKRFDAKETK